MKTPWRMLAMWRERKQQGAPGPPLVSEEAVLKVDPHHQQPQLIPGGQIQTTQQSPS